MLPESVFAWPVLLRPFGSTDAARVQELAGDRTVSDTTAVIPHPYPDGMAETWIDKHAAERALGTQYIYAITRADDRLLVGAIALRPIADENENVGYWIGREYWGNGYATAAARALIALAFNCLDCQQLTASHQVRNAASGRVLEKCGLSIIRRESRAMRGRDEAFYVRGLTRDAWERSVGAP
ncbi:MAG: GNAT family N-acetyltransferase [Betaproteobacteria bacterium]